MTAQEEEAKKKQLTVLKHILQWEKNFFGRSYSYYFKVKGLRTFFFFFFYHKNPFRAQKVFDRVYFLVN